MRLFLRPHFVVALSFALSLALSLALLLSVSAATAAEPPVVSLRTEWFPLAGNDLPAFKPRYGKRKKAPPKAPLIESRLLRELARQAVLLAAREELGLATRDETLGETLVEAEHGLAPKNPSPGNPTPKNPTPKNPMLDVHLRVTQEHTFECGFGSEGPGSTNLHRFDGKFENIYRCNTDLAGRLTDRLPEIVAGLERAGLQRQAPAEATPLDADSLAAAERLLLEMNFVAAFEALHTAHAAIGEGQPAAAWLPVLARGYANLSMHTRHFWSSHTDAFAARSLLYAERLHRLAEASPDASPDLSRDAGLTRAYAWAIIGLHAEALEQLATVVPANAKNNDAKNNDTKNNDANDPAAAADLPAWAKVIAPCCRFQAARFATLREEHPELTELAWRLEWDARTVTFHGPWIAEYGPILIERCPLAFCVYETVLRATHYPVYNRSLKRVWVALAQDLPDRLNRCEILPGRVLQAVRKVVAKPRSPDDPNDLSYTVDAATAAIVDALSRDSDDHRSDVLSFETLGSLIAEQQVLRATRAERQQWSYNAAPTPDENALLFAGHRYERFASAQGLERDQRPAALAGLEIVDPRYSQHWMLGRLSSSAIEKATGLDADALFSRALVDHGYTFHGIGEAGPCENFSLDFLYKVRRYTEHLPVLRLVSPHSPLAAKIDAEYAHWLKPPQLKALETVAGDDPEAWLEIGVRYFERPKPLTDDAVRCLEKSLAISTSWDATRELADAYYAKGDHDKWLALLEGFLLVDNSANIAKQIYDILGKRLIAQRRYREAEPFVLKAIEATREVEYGGTYWASDARVLSIDIYTALADWERAEKHVRAASESRSEFKGNLWYLWCRRTGRGDLAGAYKLMGEWVKANATNDYHSNQLEMMVYEALEGDFRAAYERCLTRTGRTSKAIYDYGQNLVDGPGLGRYTILTWLMNTALLAEQLGDEQVRDAAIASIRNRPEKNYKAARLQNVDKTALVFCDLLDPEAPDVTREQIERLLVRRADKLREFRYCLGRALDMRGRVAEAESLWRIAASEGISTTHDGSHGIIYSALAGHELVSRYGIGLGGDAPWEAKPVEAAAP